MDGLESLEDVMKDIEERPFIDEEFLMQQCMDSWAFALELFGDALAEADSKLAELVDGMGDDDDPEMHKSFHRAAHALKGQAFTLGLGKMGRTCELLEKWICSVEEAVRAGVAIKDDARLQLWLSCRKPLVEFVRAQFQELRDYLPAVKEKAAAEVPTEDAEDATADT